MSKLTDSIKLMAKTGLFFANCDGEYDAREKAFIEDFVAGIEVIRDLEPAVKYGVGDALNHTYTLEEVVGDTRQLLDDHFTGQERTAILQAIKAFIEKVISVDGEVCKREQDNLQAWEKAMGLS